jgi:hypothetical protein
MRIPSFVESAIIPGPAQEPEPVPVHYRGDILVAVAAVGKDLGNLLQVRYRIQVDRRLFAAEAAIEIAAKSGMGAIPGQLANVIDMIGNVRQSNQVAASSCRAPRRSHRRA